MPYPAELRSGPKSAPIVKAGHTGSSAHGTDESKKGNIPSVHELGITTSKR